MEQHPIPQQITSYEFKLVGEMTIKQFGKAAGGIILALLLNSTKLVFFVKWPIMFVLAGGGLAMAFVPFQDRPLETWLAAFIKSIYNPTIYLYHKKADLNWLGVDWNKKLETDEEETIEVPIKKEDKIKEFIQSLPSVKREAIYQEDIEIEEKEQDTNSQIQSIKEEEEKKVEIKSEVKPEEVKEADWREDVGKLGLKREKLEATGEAEFGSIPMPTTPETANTLVGMVVDSVGKIIEEAIVEIQDSEGNPSRVVKTNSLGQFKTLTPLANGGYLLIPEKEGYKFDRVKLTMTGEIVPPIKIKAIGAN
jgi:hypothetical protein